MLRIWRAVGVQPAIYLPPTLIFTATTLRWCRRLSGKMCISTRYVALPSSFLFSYSSVPSSNVYTNVRAPYVPASPLLQVFTYRVLLIGVQPTDRPVVRCFVLDDVGWSIICQPMRFRSKFVAIRAVAWYVSVDLPYRMPRRNLRTYRAVINVRLNGSMITR